MSFGDLVEDERRKQQQWDAEVAKNQARRRQALERWSQGVKDFIALKLPTIPFGIFESETRSSGFLGWKTEKFDVFRKLGEGWRLQHSIRADRNQDGQSVIFLSSRGELYGDGTGRQYEAGASGNVDGIPSGGCCVLEAWDGNMPEPSPPGNPDRTLKLLAEYAATHLKA